MSDTIHNGDFVDQRCATDGSLLFRVRKIEKGGVQGFEIEIACRKCDNQRDKVKTVKGSRGHAHRRYIKLLIDSDRQKDENAV